MVAPVSPRAGLSAGPSSLLSLFVGLAAGGTESFSALAASHVGAPPSLGMLHSPAHLPTRRQSLVPRLHVPFLNPIPPPPRQVPLDHPGPPGLVDPAGPSRESLGPCPQCSPAELHAICPLCRVLQPIAAVVAPLFCLPGPRAAAKVLSQQLLGTGGVCVSVVPLLPVTSPIPLPNGLVPAGG